MSPTLMRLLAAALVVVAAVLAVIGWRISQQPAPVAQAPVSPQALAPQAVEERPASEHTVVVAARDLALGQRLDPEAEPQLLRVVSSPEPVAGSFAAPDELADRQLTRPVPEGEILRPAHFAAGGTMAQAIPPGKRAIAVGVDEVIGGGGFLAPGDRVDVLYQAQARSTSGGQPPQLARRLFENVQVVSYGEALQGVTNDDGEPPALRSSGRTAVLAMDSEQAASLLLAENTGRLRLALIGAEEHRQLLAREADRRAEASPPGVLPALAGLPDLEPQDATETETTAALTFGPAVLFDELITLTPAADSNNDAPRRSAPQTQSRRVIQHIGGETRVVELPTAR